MTEALEAPIAWAYRVRMGEQPSRERRLRFVYVDTPVENERITREIVAAADGRVARDDRRATPDEGRG